MIHDEYQLVIDRLYIETQSERVIWRVSDISPQLTPDEKIIGKVYYTTFKGLIFRIFKYVFKAYAELEDKFYTASAVRLEIIDNKGISEWTFPNGRNFNSLYELIRYLVSGIKELIEDIDKLEIISARYGAKNNFIEIKDILNGKIVNDKLEFIVSNELKSDPIPGLKKKLFIEYSYMGIIKNTTFKEGESVVLPEN